MSVEEFIKKNSHFESGLNTLREILLSTELEETIKWGMPTYCIGGKNIIGMGAFKNYFGLWFFQGALLTDSQNLLRNAQEGKTEAMRQWRFKEEGELDHDLINKYVKEAIDNHYKGKEVKIAAKPLIIPEELQKSLDADPSLKEAFEKLKLTKKREFVEYISIAKREVTKQSRLQKIKPMILNDIGLNDKYR